jgi:pyrroline-5-carboxylate reductase
MVITQLRIAIIGAGHLGLAVAETLVARGLKKEKLRLSHGGSAETSAHIAAAGLAECVAADNAEMVRNADLVFLAVRPSAVGILAGLPFGDVDGEGAATVVSTIAGLSAAALERICGVPVNRIMLSGPDSIKTGKAVGAYFSDDIITKAFLAHLHVTAYPVSDEGAFHVFTAAMCLPSAFLQQEISGISGSADLTGAYTAVLPFWDELVAWAYRATPRGFCADEKLAYINAMATKGGVTEAIVAGIAEGCSLVEAFERGVNRSRAIAAANT